MRFAEQNKKRIDPRYFSGELLKEQQEFDTIKSKLDALGVSTKPFNEKTFSAAERNKINSAIMAYRYGEGSSEQIRAAIDLANKNAQTRAAQPAKQMTPQEKQAAAKLKADLEKKSIMGAFKNSQKASKMFADKGQYSDDVMKKAFSGTGGRKAETPGQTTPINTKPDVQKPGSNTINNKKLQESIRKMLLKALIKALND